MDRRLVSENGEHITLLGVMSIENGDQIVQDADAVILAIKKLLLQDSQIEDVLMTEVASLTGLNLSRISLVVRVMNDYGRFYNGASYEAERHEFRSIRVSGDDEMYYRYINFPGMQVLAATRVMESQHIAGDEFSYEERITMNERLNSLKKEIEALKLGQEIIWTDFMREFQELKALVKGKKKTWYETFLGKVFWMTASKMIPEEVSKKMFDWIKSESQRLLHY